MKKVILVTGASKGIGRDITKYLARMGNIVIANYNKSEKEAIELKDELLREKVSIEIFKADVSSRIEVKEMIKFVLDKFNRIDVLINNAGISEFKMFMDETDEDWDRIININLYSVFCTTQEILTNMIHNKKGCIINISSVWGMVGASCETIYSVSKAGIDALTKSLAKELGPSNIRVNSIAPGIIDTAMNGRLSNEELSEIRSDIPLGRLGRAIDIAKCINWLIEDEFTTGQIISVNGGWVIT